MKILFMRGMQASGKSTWAKDFILKNQDYKRVCRDDLRHMANGYKFTKDNEKLITSLEQSIISHIIIAGYNLIIDKMNLNKNDFDNDIEFIKTVIKDNFITSYDAVQIEVKEFPIKLEEAIERDKQREFPIGEKVLTNTWNKYSKELNDMLERRIADIKIEYNTNLCDCILVDIDGTLAIRCDRSPYDFGKVLEDTLNTPIKDLIDLIRKGYYKPHLFQVIIFSGRDDSCIEDTEKWLKENDVYYDFIYMRRTGDRRKDSVVKKEMFNAYIKDKYNCLYWIDDRAQVISMVRNELGICCLDVSGHEF